MKAIRKVSKVHTVVYGGVEYRMDDRTPIGATVEIKGIEKTCGTTLLFGKRRQEPTAECVGQALGFTRKMAVKLAAEGLLR